MKKFFTVLIAVIMAISVFAFSACGGNSGNAKGSIDGKYAEITTAEQFQALAEKVENIKPAAEDAELAGGVLKSNAELKLTVGGKSVTLTGSEVLNLIIDLTKINSESEELEAIKGAAVNAKLSAKADKGFGTALTGLADKLIAADLGEGEEDENADENAQIKAIMALIDDFKIDVDANAYIKENTVYADTKVTGIPESIQALVPAGVNFEDLANGVKCSLTVTEFESILNLLMSMAGGMIGNRNYNAVAIAGASNYEAEESDSILPSFEQINEYLAMAGAKLSAEMTDKGTKIKLATTADTKTIVNNLIGSIVPEEMEAIVSNLAFSKVDVEIYLSIDANGVITAAAAKIDVAVSATVLGTAISVSLNSAADCSLTVPEIKYPSFEGYDSIFGGQEAA